MRKADLIDAKTAPRELCRLLPKKKRSNYEEDHVRFAFELCKPFVDRLKKELPLPKKRRQSKQDANLLRARDCLHKHPDLERPSINGQPKSFLTFKLLADMFVSRSGRSKSSYDMTFDLVAHVFSRLLGIQIQPRQVRSIVERAGTGSA
jgi:hypothetical protein